MNGFILLHVQRHQVLCIQSGKAGGSSGRNLNFRWVAMELSGHLR